MSQALVLAKQIQQYINKIPAYGEHSPNMYGCMCGEEMARNKHVRWW